MQQSHFIILVLLLFYHYSSVSILQAQTSFVENDEKQIEAFYGKKNILALYFDHKEKYYSPQDAHLALQQQIRKKVFDERGEIKRELNWHVSDELGINIIGLFSLIGDLESVEKFIKAGASSADLDSSLGLAILYPQGSDVVTIDRYLKMIQLLLDAGANINYASDKQYLASPLWRALRFHRFSAAKILLKNHASLDSHKLIGGSYSTLSLLAMAVESCDHELLNLLAKQGATFEENDFTNETFLRNLKTCKDPLTLTILRPLLDKSMQGAEDKHDLESLKTTIIKNNDFEVNRNLANYRRYLHCGSFLDSLREKKVGHILDGGSGENYAMTDLLQHDDQINISSISYQINRDLQQVLNPSQRERFNLLTGRYFDDINDEELISKFGKFDAILDYFGIFSYSTNPDQVLKRYLSFLKPDGKIFLMCGNKYLEDLYTKRSSYIGHYPRLKSTLHRSCIKKVNGTIVSLLDWIDSISGIVVENIDETKIISFDSKNLKIPKLKFIKTQDVSMAPYGLFFEEEAFMFSPT
jgi:hypothetical protein